MTNGSRSVPNPALSQAEELFCAAMEVSELHERTALLEDACRTDPSLKTEVERLLAAQPGVERVFQAAQTAMEPGGDVLGALAADPAIQATLDVGGPEEATGTRIGRYRLLRVIGKGGCGVVYLAEQEEPVRRQVALKLVKLGMDTESVISRFESERQALAMMDHPAIARVYDAGSTATGRPYFVMELVQGIRITEFCDQHRLTIPERLDLFEQVCEAIQHAHQKGIIHRDIKPSNILVALREGVPAPKIIDFGIAKSTQQRLSDHTLSTSCGQVMGTPAYMSPEQMDLRTLDIDTRSDIYSLGVLLYELLAGVTPFDAVELTRGGLDEMRHIVREVEPPGAAVRLAALPSGAVDRAAELRCIDSKRLQMMLRGDLSYIAMRALEKDRERRYGTASGLAADVRHFRRNEPVAARPPSRVYRMCKWIRRNRVLFAASLSVALALATGFGVSAWMFLREKEARREAEQARANETLLRSQAEIRESITLATVLLNQGRMADADALVAGLPVQLCPPYMEEVRVFRTLADWNALEKRWPEAAARAVNAVHLNGVDVTDQSGAVTCDYMSAAAALVAAGDTTGYRELCREGRARFSTTKSPVAAEQIIKVNLLLSTSPDVSAELAPLIRVAEGSLSSEARSRPNTVEAWCLMSLALCEYRRGHFATALETARAVLTLDDAPARTATMQLIAAMAMQHLGRHAEAAEAVANARKTIEARFAKPLGSEAMDTWYSWLMAKTLLTEAGQMVGVK